MRYPIFGGLLALAILGVPPPGGASANTITFGTTGPYGLVNGSYEESGFTYSTYSGGLNRTNLGNSGDDMEAQWTYGGGVLRIVGSTPNTDFTYAQLDFAAYTAGGFSAETIIVTGLDRNGNVVASDSYTLSNTNIAYPKFGNWTTEYASALAGRDVRELLITLPGGLWGGSSYLAAIDNVVLNPVSTDVPAPLRPDGLDSGWAGAEYERRGCRNARIMALGSAGRSAHLGTPFPQR